jgi:drug/metabolite transporter (DMT)-like permease
VVDRLRGASPLVLAAFAVVYLVWGSTFLAIRMALDTIPPFALNGLRLSSAGACMLLWALLRREPWPNARAARNAIVTGLLLPTVGNTAVTLGTTHVPSGLVALLVGSIPLFMAALGALGAAGPRTSIRPRQWAGLLAGFAGIGLLVASKPARHDVAMHGWEPVLWALVPVLGSLSWAWGSLWSRRVEMPASPVISTGLGLAVGGAAMLAGSVASGDWARLDVSRVSATAWAALAYLSVFGSVLGFSAYLFLLRRVSPTMVSTYAFVNPVVAMLLGLAFAGERFTPLALGASGLIVAAVAILVTTPAATARAAPALRGAVPAD